MPEVRKKRIRRTKALPPSEWHGTTKKWQATRDAIQKKFEHEPHEDIRKWFMEVEHKRRKIKENEQRLVIFTVEKETGPEVIARTKNIPGQIKKHVLKVLPNKVATVHHDYEEITRLWHLSVGDAIVGESRFLSFKQGIVTIEILSSTLLQEIRQFHQQAILADMRDIWTLDHPLLGIKYILGKV